MAIISKIQNVQKYRYSPHCAVSLFEGHQYSQFFERSGIFVDYKSFHVLATLFANVLHFVAWLNVIIRLSRK